MQDNSVLFVVRKESCISLRRYFALADIFYHCYEFNIVFFAVDDCDSDFVKRCFDDAKQYYGVNELPYDYVHAGQLIKKSLKVDCPLSVEKMDTENELLSLFLDHQLESSFSLISSHYRAFESFARNYKPVLVIYDIPILWQTHVLIDACRTCGAKIVSLEHAEGIGKIYSSFKIFADYYISYGEMNSLNLNRMGVPDHQIFQTGNIDTDFMHAVLKRFQKESVWSKPSLLLILKPSKVPGANHDNNELVKVSAENFCNYKILVRVHPSVKAIKVEMDLLKEIVSQYPNCHFADSSEPLSLNLVKVNSVISFPSYALVESIMMKRKTICISGVQDFAYVDWSSYGISTINKNVIHKALVPEAFARAELSEAQVNKLIRDFRHRNDDGATRRIVKELIALIDAA